MKLNKGSKKFYKELKRMVPFRGSIEKNLFENIKFKLYEMNDNNPKITYEEICNELGEINEIISDYFYNCDSSYLIKRTKLARTIKIGLFLIILTVCVLCAYKAHLLHEAFQIARDSSLTRDMIFFQ